MGPNFANITFTPSVLKQQEALGSLGKHGDTQLADARLGVNEIAFIENATSFYMATVTETGWPYIQHRGGPAGFVRTLDDKTIGFSDFKGNRQYITTGNLAINNRVSLFFMDYLRKARFKLLGRARVVDSSDSKTLADLAPANNRVRIERGILITIEAFDWNCSQHITQRFTALDVQSVVSVLQTRVQELEEKVAELAKHQT